MSYTSTTRVPQNTVINLTGSIAPIAISLITVPIYLRLIGNERYGVMAIVWVLLGYFGVFNLGLGKATSNKIAKFVDSSDAEIEALFWTAFIINAIAGLAGGALLLLFGQMLFEMVLTIPQDMRSEAISTLPWLAASVPITTISAVLNGALEGRERFGTVNILAVSGTILSQLLPLVVVFLYGPALEGLIGATVISMIITSIVTLLTCYKLMPLSGRLPHFNRRLASELARFGGWVTVTALIGPFLVSLDQVFIGATIGVKVLPYYSVPYNFVNRLALLPGSLSRTLFPRFSMLPVGEAKEVAVKSCWAISALLTPLVIAGLVFLRPFLKIWIGIDMAETGGAVGEIILLGIWINALAVIPYAFLQGQGKPHLTAAFHLIELPFYLVALWLGLHFLGLPGAALAWTLRVLLDTVLLFVAARFSMNRLAILVPTGLFTLLILLGSLTIFQDSFWRITAGGAAIAAVVIWTWRIASLQIRLMWQTFRDQIGLTQTGRIN